MKLSLRILIINILTLFALISFNHQNYKLISKIKAAAISEMETASLKETASVKIPFNKFTQVILAAFIPDSPKVIVREFANLTLAISNSTLNHLYLAHSPPVFA